VVSSPVRFRRILVVQRTWTRQETAGLWVRKVGQLRRFDRPSRKASRPVDESFGSRLLERKPAYLAKPSSKASRPLDEGFGSRLLERKPAYLAKPIRKASRPLDEGFGSHLLERKPAYLAASLRWC
jgi:hypothetical protein